MNPVLPMAVTSAIEAYLVIKFRLALNRAGNELLDKVRRIENPPYPITASEVLPTLQKYSQIPFKSVPLTVQVFWHHMQAIWGKHNNEELSLLSKYIRHLIYGTLAKMLLVFMACVVLAVVMMEL